MFDAGAVLEFAGKVARIDAAAGSDEDLLAMAKAVAASRDLLDVGLAAVVTELDARGVCFAEFGLSAPQWLAREARQPRQSTHQVARVGKALRRWLPQVAEAVMEGRLSFEHGRVLADLCNPRIAEAWAALQSELIALAEEISFERW